ncbi:uncharacterized protein LOC122442467 [Cervus canadensis]|uniref:uncharacterized protein LOC122442467 n=1 Tax=Cervus canadensis TaxID=1574408 RepID=UPI001C9E2390|nr:uncharacterized protein LOC122442467 [Cervus canadensis]
MRMTMSDRVREGERAKYDAASQNYRGWASQNGTRFPGLRSWQTGIVAPQLDLIGRCCRPGRFRSVVLEGVRIAARACAVRCVGVSGSWGEENSNPLQHSCLENPGDRGAWWAAVCGVAQSRTRLKRLSSSSRNLRGLRFNLIRDVYETPEKGSGTVALWHPGHYGTGRLQTTFSNPLSAGLLWNFLRKENKQNKGIPQEKGHKSKLPVISWAIYSGLNITEDV